MGKERVLFDQIVEIIGEQAKRIDKEFQERLEKMPFLSNKQFFGMSQQPISVALQQNFSQVRMSNFHAASSLHEFLKKSVNS